MASRILHLAVAEEIMKKVKQEMCRDYTMIMD